MASRDNMNTNFWIRLAVSALVIVGVWNALGRGQILFFVGDFLEWLPQAFGKPLGLCMPCMANLYGSTFWFLTGGDVWWWPVFVLALSGLMRLIADNLIRE